jgi:ribose transport system substrate-binding protein
VRGTGVGLNRWRARRARRFVALAVGLLLCAGIATAYASSGPQQAAAFVKSVSVQKINIGQKITNKEPKKLTIDWLSCAYQSCITLGTYAQQAAAHFGWKVKYINAGETPQEYQAAAAAIVSDKPDVAVIAGTPADDFPTQLAQMKAEGIKLVGFATSPEPELKVMVRPPAYNIAYGKLAASFVISHAGAPTTIGFVNTAGTPASEQNTTGMHQGQTEYCPKCTIDEYDVPPAAALGTAAPLIVNWLRGNSGIKWVVLDNDGLAEGLPAALTSAGISVNIVTLFPSTVSIPLLQSGQEVAALATNDAASSWDTIDAVARLEAGQSTSASTSFRAVPWVVLTKANVGSALPLGPAGFQNQFLKLWGK